MEGDIKREMSSEAPEQSPLDRAKAEANELIQKVQDDLDSIRTAPVNELEMRINSLRDSFQASQESAIVNVETALKSSDTLIDDLEQSLQAANERIASLDSDLSDHKEEAETRTCHLKVELASQRINYVSTKQDLQKAKNELEEANRRAADLQNDFGAVQQRNVSLQAELDLAKKQPANLEHRLKEVEQRNASLETDLRSATQRASTAEDELKAFKSRFKLINDDMNALASSSEQQSTVTKPASSFTPPPVARPSVARRSLAQVPPAPASVTRRSLAPVPTPRPSFALSQHQQVPMGERKGGPQRHDTRVRTQSPESHASSSTGDEEPDLSHCQWILNGIMSETNEMVSPYFFSPENTDVRSFLTFKGVKFGPMNLSIMKEKLTKGAYTSSTSFKADFDLMVADCKRLNPPDSLICETADELVKVFERSWSIKRTHSEKPRARFSQDPESSGHKRKASTEGPVSSEGGRKKKLREDTPFNHDAVQPPSSDIDEHVSVSPAMDRSRQMAEKSRSLAECDSVWQGHLTTGTRIGFDVAFDVIAKRVSVVKPVKTRELWKGLLPDDLHVTAPLKMIPVEHDLFSLNFGLKKDIVTLCLEPASENDTLAFHKLSRYLISRGRYATISHQQHHAVSKIYLIPSLPKNQDLRCIRSLEYKVLPAVQAKNTMFMVIVYHVFSDDGEPIRQAWNDIIKTVHSPDMSEIAGIRDCFIHHPLPIKITTLVFRAERFINLMLRNVPLRQRVAGAKLTEYPSNFLKLSYPKLYQSGTSKIEDVKLPEIVFIFGAVMGGGYAQEFLVVDVENRDRPLWVIPRASDRDSGFGTAIGLLRSKFPKSWQEWEENIDDKLRKTQSENLLKGTGMQIERF